MGPKVTQEQFQSILPLAPYCTNDLQRGLVIRGRSSAIGYRSIQVNAPWKQAVLVFDVDHDQAGAAWLEFGLAPTWTAINPENNHAHLGYLLDVPVLTHPDSRDHPKRYLKAVYEAMRICFEADHRYSGLITKNTLHVSHSVQWFGYQYDLGYLARNAFQIVPADEVSERLRQRRIDHANTPLNEVTEGDRNDSIFFALRTYAYQAVRQFRGDNRIYSEFYRDLLDQAENLNSILMQPLGFREVAAIASSVAKWTMAKDPAKEKAFRQRQAAKRRKPDSFDTRQPWQQLGIGRMTFFRWLKKGIVDQAGNMLSTAPRRGRPACSN